MEERGFTRKLPGEEFKKGAVMRPHHDKGCVFSFLL